MIGLNWVAFKMGSSLFTRQNRKLILLALAVVGIWVRTPQLLSHPRFWAEEGSTYFQYALINGFWPTLFFLDPRAGYLDITRHLSAGLALLVPLEYAPHLTTFIAYVLQLIACVIVIYGRSQIFVTDYRRLLGCLIILFAPTVIDEVWLNTVNSMTWYGLIGFLIAVDRMSLLSRSQVLSYRLILAIGAVSGPYVCMLAPLFGLIALRERTRNTIVNAGIVFGSLVPHGLVVWHFVSSNTLNEKRFSDIQIFDTIYAVFWAHLATPIIGSGWVTSLSQIPFGLTLFMGVFIVFALAAIGYIYFRPGCFWQSNWKVVFSWVCFSVCTTLTSYGYTPDGRYAVLPGWMLLFLLLSCSSLKKLRFVRFGSIVFLVLVLGVSLTNYSLDGRTLCDGSSWSTDIWTAKNSQHSRIVEICPSGWTVELPSALINE